MSELTECIELVHGLMKDDLYIQHDRSLLMKPLTRLIEEGVTKKDIVDLLVARKHVKQEEFVLGKRNHDHLSLDDLREVEKILGVNEITLVNQAAWTEKFKSGRAKYWCPKCGYAGNEEFRDLKLLGGDILGCYQCGHMAYVKYFTRAWTPEEQTKYETEQQAIRAAHDEKEAADKELRLRQQASEAAVHDDAILIAQALDRFIWVENEGDDDGYQWDETLSDSVWLVRKMTYLLTRRQVSVDTVIEYFKTNLKVPDDAAALRGEVNHVTARFLEGK